MPNRRSSLAILAGVALFPLALQKFRDVVSPYLITSPLMQIHKDPIAIGSLELIGSNGQPYKLSNLLGKHVLVNIWATWCPPCRKEMPSLDRLQVKLAPKNEPEIVAISVDQVSLDQLRAFYSANGIVNLALFSGNETEVFELLSISGLPTTLLLNHDGNEIARLVGPAAWDSSEIMRQLSALIANTPFN